MNIKLKELKINLVGKILLGLVGIYVLYLLAVGLGSTTCPEGYKAPELGDTPLTDRDKAMIMAQAVTHSLDSQLNSTFGWIPNDLLLVPSIDDNITNYQKGVIYATRPASDMVAKTISRFGQNDTLDPRLVDATSRYFPYSADVWGWAVVYNTEGKYKDGIQNWISWAASVDSGAKNAGIYNVKSDDVYQILKYCTSMLEYTLGNLNKDKISHFKADDDIYFAKGVASVVEDVLCGIIAVDSSVVERGGKENVEVALQRLDYIRNFNPWYVVAGGNDIGDAMLPNHIAALARHIDVASNRITDIRDSMEK